jgi:hypothetical protein
MFPVFTEEKIKRKYSNPELSEKKLKVDVIYKTNKWGRSRCNPDIFRDSGFFDVCGEYDIAKEDGSYRDMLDSEAEIILTEDLATYRRCVEWDFLANYRYKVFMLDEPVYSPNRHRGRVFGGRDSCAAHHKFLDKIGRNGTVVLYSCAREQWISGMQSVYFTDFIDYKLEKEGIYPIDPLKKTKTGICAYSPRHVGVWPDRAKALSAAWAVVKDSPEFEYRIFHRGRKSEISYADLSREVRDASFQIIPNHALWLHNLRFLQSWFVGTIPVVIHEPNWVENSKPLMENIYGDFVERHNYKTCILTDPIKLKDDLDRCIRDDDYRIHMLQNIRNMDLNPLRWRNVCFNIYQAIKATEYDYRQRELSGKDLK